jgi:hypothetical protein
MKWIFRAGFTPFRASICAAAPLRRRAMFQPHAYICVGFRDHIVQRMEFDDHEDLKRIGMIRTIAAARLVSQG